MASRKKASRKKASRKKTTSSEAAATGSTEIIQQYLFDSDSNLSSLSEDSSSEERDDGPDERTLSETGEEVIHHQHYKET